MYQQRIFAHNRFEIIHTINKKSLVFKCRDRLTKKIVCCKVFPFHDGRPYLQEAFASESIVGLHLAQNPHPNIMLQHDQLTVVEEFTFEDANEVQQTVGSYGVIVFEYIEGTTLLDYLIRKTRGNKKLQLNQAKYLLYQIMSGHLHMVQQGLAHLDLKLENMILTNDNIVKIIDFGHAQLIGDQITHSIGTIFYIPPEINQVRLGLTQRVTTPTQKVDIYELGVIFYAMIFGKFPNSITTKSNG